MKNHKNAHINLEKIRGLIVERGKTTREVSKFIGIKPVSLLRRLKGERDFTADELYLLSDILKTKVDIFFK